MVLEARENAETVGYSVIGEKEKDASNVIDYDIHDEITIDTSSVFNANNDTTTGMANVIPGINAPKLLMGTSIYEPTPAVRTVEQTMKGTATSPAIYPDSPSTRIRSFVTSASTGTKEFTYYDSPDGSLYSGMKAPYTGSYSITATYVGTSSSYHYYNDWRIVKGGYPDDITFHTSTTYNNYQSYTETFTVDLNKGDCIAVFMTMEKSGAYYSEYPRVEVTITKTS